jgi:hypothetical protein
MDKKIPPEIMDATTRCKHEFSCLENENFCDTELCRIDYINGENIIFLKSNKPHDCPYRVGFADQMICRCPVRYYHLKSNA